MRSFISRGDRGWLGVEAPRDVAEFLRSAGVAVSLGPNVMEVDVALLVEIAEQARERASNTAAT